MRDKNVVKTLEHHMDDVIGIDCSKSGDLVTGSDDGMIVICDVNKSWQHVQRIATREEQLQDIKENEVKRVRFSNDGQMLAAACSSKRVLVYKKRGNVFQLYDELMGHDDCVFDVAWSTCTQTKKN